MSTATLRHAALAQQQLRQEDLGETATFNTSKYTKTGFHHQKALIQTHNGMDLGALLAQDVKGNATDNHIFADDDSTGSPAVSSVISDTDISRVSILNIHSQGVENPEEEVDEEGYVPEVQDLTIDEWEMCNRQFGKEVAQHFKDKVRAKEEERNSKYSIQFPDESTLSCHSMGSSLFQCAGPQTHERAAIIASEKSRGFSFESASSKNTKSGGAFSKYVKKLRKKRRSFLDTIFTSKAASKVVSSAEVGSQGSTASTASLMDQISPKSGDSVDQPQTVSPAVKEDPPSLPPRDLPAEKIDVKDKKTGKPIRRFGPHMRTRSAPVIDTTGQDVGMQNRHSSPVVDSILKQFSAPIQTAEFQRGAFPASTVHRRSSRVGSRPVPMSTPATSTFRRASVDNGIIREQSIHGQERQQRVPHTKNMGSLEQLGDSRQQEILRQQHGSGSYIYSNLDVEPEMARRLRERPTLHPRPAKLNVPDNRKFHL